MIELERYPLGAAHSRQPGKEMANNDLRWITEVIEKLQVPQRYNERERLTQILKKAAPALIKALNHSAVHGFRMWDENSDDEESLIPAGHTCNACGQDHCFEDENPKHRSPCAYEDLLQVLEDIQKEEDK